MNSFATDTSARSGTQKPFDVLIDVRSYAIVGDDSEIGALTTQPDYSFIDTPQYRASPSMTLSRFANRR